MKVKELVLLSLCTGLIVVSQAALASLPNIETVSLLFILYAIHFGRKSLYIVYGFVLLQGLLHGFGLWWIMYLYIWTILVLISLAFKNRKSPLFWAITSGLYGLFFGALGTFPYFFIGLFGENGSAANGLKLMFAYWVSGIPFDITHSVGNFFLCLLLFRPLDLILRRLTASGEVN